MTQRIIVQGGVVVYTTPTPSEKIDFRINGDLTVESLNGLTWPTLDGSNGQVLTTDGAGNVSWETSTGGTVTSVGVSSSGTYSSALTVGSSPVTSSGSITITPNVFGTSTSGVVPSSGGGSANFLRADGTWAAPIGTTYSAGTAISVLGNIISNTGVTSVASGTNISVSAGTGAVTISVTGTVPTATSATTATNIAGGAAGSLPYQSAINTTSMLSVGTVNQVLVSGTSPSWTGTPTISSVTLNGSAPQLSLSNATSNWLEWNTAGIAPPSISGTRSVGTKLVLYPNAQIPGYTDFGFGIDSATLWSSVSGTTQFWKWYAGTTVAMQLNGTGQVAINPGNPALATGTPTKFILDPTYTNSASSTSNQLKLVLVPAAKGVGLAIGNAYDMWFHTGDSGAGSYNFALDDDLKWNISRTGNNTIVGHYGQGGGSSGYYIVDNRSGNSQYLGINTGVGTAGVVNLIQSLGLSGGTPGATNAVPMQFNGAYGYGLALRNNGDIVTGYAPLSGGVGNVLTSASYATTATDGFLFLTTSAGAPTGTPTAYTGRAPIHIDATNNALYFYTNGAWRLPLATTASALTTSRSISATGDAAWTVNFDGSANATASITLATVNSSPQTDTLRKITVNGKGLVTATSAVSSSDITTALGFTPVNKAGDTMTGALILNADPTNDLGAATKSYVDAMASGVNVHAACVTSTTAALPASIYNNGVAGVGATLTASANASLNTVGIGGYSTLTMGNRILVKDEVNQVNNGIYTVTVLGTDDPGGSKWVLTRATDFDGSPTNEVEAGDLTYIQQGTLAGTQWVQTNVGTGSNPSPAYSYIIVGTDNITFSQFSGPGSYTAGTGINIASNAISNTGVLSNVAGTGISVSGSTGNVTITNAGVTSVTAGTNISVSAGTGAITVSLTGTVPTATSATTATNIAAGATGNVPYQSAAGTTAFVANAAGVLQAATSGATPAWTTTPTLTGTNFSGIPNGALINSSITIGSTGISLGATATALAGLTSVSATTFTGALTGNASTATSATTATNIASGATGNVPYQSAAGTTAFVTNGAGVLQAATSGATPSWTTTPTLTGTNFSGIPNGALTNSSVTVNGTAISLGSSGTVTADAGTLTGTILASNVVSSSLTSVGTLLSLSVSDTITGSTSGTSGALSLTYTPSSTTGAAMIVSGKDTRGGVGYFDFLTATNTTSGATNPAKSFRLNSTGGIEVVNSVYTSVIFTLTDAGAVTATSFNATSTKRVKKSIKNLSKKYLSKFAELRPCEYDRRDTNAHEFGFVAEEMAAIYPEIVGLDQDGKPGSIDYSRLSAILTAKVQEQQSVIEQLQSQMSKVLELLKGIK